MTTSYLGVSYRKFEMKPVCSIPCGQGQPYLGVLSRTWVPSPLLHLVGGNELAGHPAEPLGEASLTAEMSCFGTLGPSVRGLEPGLPRAESSLAPFTLFLAIFPAFSFFLSQNSDATT